MTKELTIYDYDQEPVKIEIPDYEKVTEVSCEVISGDEVLTVTYEDGSEVTFDSSQDRLHDYDDGFVNIPLTLIDKISDIPNSYDMLRYFELHPEDVFENQVEA